MMQPTTPTPHLADWEKLKTTFIRNVQHELRTPVAVILGYADILQRGDTSGLDPAQQKAVGAIRHQATALRTMAERVTLLVSLETGEIIEQPVNLADLITNVNYKQQHEASKKQITLTTAFPYTLPRAVGNPDYLAQALDCLVENALKFTPEGGEVTVAAKKEGDWLQIKVSDTGIGIEAAEQSQIFTTFFQVDGSTTRRYGGLGLGLAVVKAVIKAHEGHIELESQPGQGSCFTLSFPILSQKIQPDRKDHPQITPHRILVVDDEATIALSLQEGLEKLPYCEVAMATSGEQALALFDDVDFDLLITDYRMPGIDGFSLARQVQAHHPETATIMLTAYGDSISPLQISDMPVRRILDKPVKLTEIRNVTLETLGVVG